MIECWVLYDTCLSFEPAENLAAALCSARECAPTLISVVVLMNHADTGCALRLPCPSPLRCMMKRNHSSSLSLRHFLTSRTPAVTALALQLAYRVAANAQQYLRIRVDNRFVVLHTSHYQGSQPVSGSLSL